MLSAHEMGELTSHCVASFRAVIGTMFILAGHPTISQDDQLLKPGQTRTLPRAAAGWDPGPGDAPGAAGTERVMSIDLYLQLDGIPGDSSLKGHEAWIEITGVDWSMSQSAGAGHGGGGGGGGGGGRPSFGALTVAGWLGSATPRLLDACARGIHLRRALLEAVTPGQSPRVTAKWELEDVLVAALSIAGAGAALADSTSLLYQRIRLTTYAQDPGGGAGQSVSGGWDIPAARPW